MRTTTEARNLDIFTREFIVFISKNLKDNTVCDFLPRGNESISIDDNFLFSLHLDDFCATVRSATMIDEARNITHFGRYISKLPYHIPSMIFSSSTRKR